jgi:hypothetical protein
MLGFLKARREKRDRAAAATRRSLAIHDNKELMAVQVPELAGMGEASGMAHTLQAIGDWNRTCTPDEAEEFATRLLASQNAWKADGLTMPYWGTLWVLRTYQAELGRDAPAVAPPVAKNGRQT